MRKACSELYRDRRATLFLIAIPLAVLLLSGLLLLARVGDALVQSQRLQDAADARALASAAAHARGMNAVATLNAGLAALGALDAGPQTECGASPGSSASERIALLARTLRENQRAALAAAPRWAAVRNTLHGNWVGSSLALSYAGLACRDRAALAVDPRDLSRLAPRAETDPQRCEGADQPGALPFRAQVARDDADCKGLSVAALDPEVQNGNVLLQTWSIAREERTPGRPARPFGLGSADRPAYAVAQAEFYFDCAGAWDDCAAAAAWTPRWTARLRRFRLPASSPETPERRRIAAAFAREAAALAAVDCEGACAKPQTWVQALFARGDRIL